jgi:hypothetical protein
MEETLVYLFKRSYPDTFSGEDDRNHETPRGGGYIMPDRNSNQVRIKYESRLTPMLTRNVIALDSIYVSLQRI